VQFSVITPSFRNSSWLKLCIASVADQGVEVEHLVQDSNSDDGTLDWLPQDSRVKAFIEKDAGMYDGVNRGLRRARGEILSYLNCDEQYLPGTLAAVGDCFARHPQVDVIFGDFIAVDVRGDYLFHRKVQVPLKHHTRISHLQTFTCATFFRRKLIDEHQLFFDPKYKFTGDGEWMLRLLERKIPMAVMRHFTSTFGITGGNLSDSAKSRLENLQLSNSAPLWVRRLKPLFILHHRLRRLAGGIYFQKPVSYAIYTPESPQKRVIHQVTRPNFKWGAWRDSKT
jgi:glycosyltransferase involved in cell wall biosynthesis